MRAEARTFVKAFAGVPSFGPPTPGQLDAAHEVWLERLRRGSEPAQFQPRAVVDCIGVAIGDHLAERTGLAWRIGTFEVRGIERSTPVLVGAPAPGSEHSELFCPPFEVAAKRIETGERGWIEPVTRTIAQELLERLGRG